MSRIGIVDPTLLGTMQVLETISSEAIIDARMARFVQVWNEHDPPVAAEYDVDNLEFDPIKINQEVGTFFELLLRDRVNQAARAVTLAFATGNDLEAIGSRYPGGVPRLPIVPSPRPYAEAPIDWEADVRYRRRIWLSPNTLTPHGVSEAYVFWALTADPTLKDASARTIPGTGTVIVTIMASGGTPTPTATQLAVVREYIMAEARQGLTDVLQVAPVQVINTDYKVRVWLFPGHDQQSVFAVLNTKIAEFIESKRWLGEDHMHSAIDGVLYQTGVYNVVIDSPATDMVMSPTQTIKVNSVTLTYAGRGE